MTILAIVVLILATWPALLFLSNLRLYQRLSPAPADAPRPEVSILIPARNEEASIGASVTAALASEGVELEVLVLDDQSEDATASIVKELAASDSRVHLLEAPPLPPGWCGKQHACHVLAEHARSPLLVFVDADVRLAPQAVVRMAHQLRASGADLISGVPYQETVTLLEKLVLPLIHFLLLGFLPMRRMRSSTHPAYAAGCGQLFVTTSAAYEKAGGHAMIRTSLHDGITLPRSYRQRGLMTDLFDATDLATCRMYRTGKEVWLGLAKNATEGLARPALIVPATILLLGGQVLPLLLLPFADELSVALLLLLALANSYGPRMLGRTRFHQSLLGAILHPLGVTILVAIQWYGLGRSLLRRPAAWKGRQYGSSPATSPPVQTTP